MAFIACLVGNQRANSLESEGGGIAAVVVGAVLLLAVFTLR